MSQDLGGGALVHGAVTLGGPVQGEGQVEDLAGLDGAVPDELDQFGQEAPDRGGAAVDVDAGHEEVVSGDGDIMRDAHEPDVPTGAGRADRLHHRLLGADGLDDRVGTEPAGEVLDLRDSIVTALFDDVRRAELAGEGLAVGVPAERDDPLGAELLGGQDAQQPDGAVTDDGDRLARAGFGGNGGEPAGTQHVRGRQQRRDQVGRRHTGRGDQRAVRERHAGQLGLRAESAHEHPVHAVRLVAGLTDLTGVVGGPEGADHEVADLDGADRGADLLDDADVLVTHDLVVHRLGAAVRPQVAAADAGRRQTDDGVGGLDDLRVIAGLDADVPGFVHDNLTHRGALLFVVGSLAGAVKPLRRAWRPTGPVPRVKRPARPAGSHCR